MNYDFANKTILITGGNSGIGHATAIAFARFGAAVVVAARRREQGLATVEQIEAAGGQALFVATDVCEEGAIYDLVERTVAHFGGLHMAFNNAGIAGDMQPLGGASVAMWDSVMATNVRSVFVALKYQVPAIIKSGGGAIVNMSAVYGSAGKAAHHAYVASKHAVIGLTRSAALECATQGVRINAICPGVTATESMRAAQEHYPQVVAELVEAHPMGRMASESEIAAGVMWLCSDHSSYVTGHPLAMDGGFLAA